MYCWQVFHCIYYTLFLASIFVGIVLIAHRAFVCGGIVIVLMPMLLFIFRL